MQIISDELADFRVFQCQLPCAMGQWELPFSFESLVDPAFQAPLSTNDEVKKAVRDMLRQHGFKPTGRSKPASEYLLKAIGQQKLGPINGAVDILNAVSYWSGLPISVVDLDRVTQPLRIDRPPAGSSYVFNASGQEIEIGNLFCLFDQDGPCANAVKDAQRTKTDDDTTRTLSVIWGTRDLPGRTEHVAQWYQALLTEAGAEVQDVEANQLD